MPNLTQQPTAETASTGTGGWPESELVDAGQVAAGDAVVAPALRLPHVVTARVVDGPMIRLSFAAVTVRLGRSTPVRRIRQTPQERAVLDEQQLIADVIRGGLTDPSFRWGDGLIFLNGDGPETEYVCVESGPDGLVLRGPDGRLFDVAVTVDVTARPADNTLA